jgi:uncharacterized protein YegP (UPF0339 family)
MAGTEHVDVYLDAGGEWRWRRVAANNQVTAVSGEGYTRKADAREAAVRENPGLSIEDLSENFESA